MAKVSFDEITKIITVTLAPDASGEVFIDVKTDLYSDGKEFWVDNENLRKFNFPIRSVGGDDLPGSKALGATFFLAADWKIKPYEASHKLVINGNLYSEDGSDPFLDTIGTYTVRIIQQVSSLVDSTVQQLKEIEYASYGGVVAIDIVNGVAGTTYNIGTLENPVNNIPDAILIANERGFETFHIHGYLILSVGDNVDGFEFIGHSPSKTTITILDAASTIGCEFHECTVSGVLDGNTVLDHCKVDDLSYVNGEIRNCRLEGPITLAGGSNAIFLDCGGINPGVAPTINMGGAGQSCIFHDYSGGLKFTNMIGDNQIRVQLDGGKVVLDSTISAGYVIVVGIGLITDNSTGTCDVNTSGLLNAKSINAAVRSECILDNINGVSGTTFPIGTYGNPVNNLDDALTICSGNGIENIQIYSDLIVESTHNISGMSIETHGIMGTEVTLTSGCDANNSVFRYVNLQGTVNNTDTLLVENCTINNLENFSGLMQNVTFNPDCTLTLGSWAEIYNCRANGDVGSEPEVSIGNSDLNIQQYRGNLKLINKTGSDRTVVGCGQANVIISSTCVSGSIQLLGTGKLELDESGINCQVDVTGLVSNDNVADAVLDEVVSEHTTISGSFGSTVDKIKKETGLIPALV